jgi:hypothetical protein
MENFFNWVTKPLMDDEVDIWLNMNNMIPEKGELFYDFCLSLLSLVKKTYLGEDTNSYETKISMSDDDKSNHFDWCWGQTVKNFKKENITFNNEGEHHDYFKSFFTDIFYNQKNEMVRNSIDNFLRDIFDRDTPFTKSDLDLYTEVYKLLDKNINYE